MGAWRGLCRGVPPVCFCFAARSAFRRAVRVLRLDGVRQLLASHCIDGLIYEVAKTGRRHITQPGVRKVDPCPHVATHCGNPPPLRHVLTRVGAEIDDVPNHLEVCGGSLDVCMAQAQQQEQDKSCRSVSTVLAQNEDVARRVEDGLHEAKHLRHNEIHTARHMFPHIGAVGLNEALPEFVFRGPFPVPDVVTFDIGGTICDGPSLQHHHISSDDSIWHEPAGAEPRYPNQNYTLIVVHTYPGPLRDTAGYSQMLMNLIILLLSPPTIMILSKRLCFSD